MSSETNYKKRRREPFNVDVKQVEIYEDLANEKDEVRLKAAHELVSRFTPESKPTEDQIRKALQRLFRGLCSGRKAARVGFSIALTEVLAQVFGSKQSAESSEISVSEAVKIFSSVTDPSGGEPGQERKDYYLGRLFGAEAIIKSSILFQSGVPLEEWNTVVGIIIDIGNAKPWLREESGWVLYRALHELATQKADVKYCEKMIEIISSNGFVKSPEGVAMWLLIQDSFPNAKLPQDVWKYNNDPLDRHDRRTLAKIMKQVSEAEDQSAALGVWNSRLNFAWDAVLSRLADSKPEGKKEKKDKKGGKESSRITFEEFWTEVVDDGLFAAASSDERKYWGFLLFMKIVDEGTLHRAEVIFTKNVVRCLMNQLAVEDRYLHRMAVKAAKTIQKRVSKEPSFASVAVKGLLSGSLQFDQITKTKTVEKIVLEADAESLQKVIERLERLIATPGLDEAKAAASSRQYLADLFVSIVRTRSPAGEEFTPVLQYILSILVRYAYFGDEQGEQIANPAISSATQELFRNRINSCLNSLISNIKDPAEVAFAIVRQIRDYQKSEEYGKFIIEIDGTIAESVDAAFKSLKKLSSKVKQDDKGTKDASVQAFRLVYSLTILQVYNGDADAVSMLDELAFCYSKFWGDKKSKKEDRSDASNALVEILLSFASKPSKLFRRMSEQVFGVFADQITADGLQSLISVIEVKENLAGQQEMFDQQDDDEDEDEDMEDADSLDSDVEVVDADEEGSDDDSDDEDDEEEEEEEDEEELAAFDAKLAEALGTHHPNDDNSSSDADMNDDEMEAVDEMLVKVFKARQQATTKKKDKQDAKETMTNFKNRVLDFLEIYVKKCHTSVLALDLILPLLRLTRKSTVKQISQRANDVLREYTRLCKGNAIPSLSTDTADDDEEEDTIEPVWDLLRAVHKEAMISGPAAHSSSASQASIFLVKVLVAQDKQNISQIVDIYAETRKAQMLSNKCHVQPGFFTDWNNWCVNAGKNMKN
ncbi:DNA-directed DNA polymerase [Talaromyces marneffei ATCC 18224]|uniref:DNA polymerase V, putative n=1 Tax=Talaromyces marneffei (strain ATCC 18224 / CBS 334.59 / QM 7333) TaxID=441960 RepID=B6QA16_TALMQ|nr:uncharacterized protein EYB26_005905 [Talaromyces marneffei]EEA26180.1 DNA polymerase V, putative [Talaromyces marneffei ATCC 18224]QGA18221.1 hypothetical protein EYB26_005905 [Talaromyces marneffei]